jgi:hypothetical protein
VTGAFFASYVALWVLVIVEGLAIFALYQHFGEMYLNTREGRASQGPDVDSELEPVKAQDLSGSTVRLAERGRPTLLVFASTDCELCGELRPDLKRFAEERAEFRTLLVCAGDLDGVSRWADGLSEVVEVVPDPGYRIATRYGVGVTPFMVGTDSGGIVRAKAIVNGLRGLETVSEHLLARELATEQQLVQLEERR